MRRPRLLLKRLRERLAPGMAPPLAALLLLFSVAGCLSTNVNVRSDGTADGAGVLVRVYKDADAVQAQHAEASGSLVELFSVDRRGAETFVHRSLAGEWGVSQLPPGKYRLRVVAVLDEGGHIRETRSGDRETDFTLKDGQTAEVKIVLKKTPTGLIVVAAVTVVILVVALAILGAKSDIKPPPPPIGLLSHLPPPPPINHVVVASELWVGPATDPARREPSSPPRVTSVFPEPASVDVARRVMPTLTLSQPLDEAKIRPDTILMLGSMSGMVTGATNVHLGLLRFVPSRELLPGETATVTVRAGGVVNPDGRRLEGDFSWSFQVAQ